MTRLQTALYTVCYGVTQYCRHWVHSYSGGASNWSILVGGISISLL